MILCQQKGVIFQCQQKCLICQQNVVILGELCSKGVIRVETRFLDGLAAIESSTSSTSATSVLQVDLYEYCQGLASLAMQHESPSKICEVILK